MKKIDISTPKYPNTFALVDDEDYEFLNQWKWCSTDKGYVYNANAPGKKMHRLIMNAKKGAEVDHINRVRHDNRKHNLRMATRADNVRNRCVDPKAKSGLKGVTTGHNCWLARINENNKPILLGSFSDKYSAAYAYNQAAKKIFKEFAWLNDIPKGFKPTPRIVRSYTSDHYGVTLNPDGRWRARIKHNTQSLSLGRFTTEIEAAKAVNAKILELGLDRPLNIIEEL